MVTARASAGSRSRIRAPTTAVERAYRSWGPPTRHERAPGSLTREAATPITRLPADLHHQRLQFLSTLSEPGSAAHRSESPALGAGATRMPAFTPHGLGWHRDLPDWRD